MKHSDIEFPVKYGVLVDTIEEMWNKGWFDCFSDEHFIIQSIKNTLPSFRIQQQMNMMSPELYSSCDSQDIFLINLSQHLRKFNRLCGDNCTKLFLEQLSGGKGNYSEDQFFEALHELHVFSYFTLYGAPKVVYEPPLGGSLGLKNPEYRIQNTFAIPGGTPGVSIVPKEDYIFDIEVKSIVGTLDESIDVFKPIVFPIIALDANKIKGLINDCRKLGFQVELPNIIHLRAFLNDAANKFEMPTTNNHFNILCLNWTFREIPCLNYYEPLSLLDNPINGLLYHRDIGMKIGLSNDVFSKISAIMIYSYPKQALMFHDLRWIHANNMCAVWINPILNEKQKLQLSRILCKSQESNPHPPIAFYSTMDKDMLKHTSDIDNMIQCSRYKN